MGKTILFSAIGGNDPVSSSTEKDGSMLHICREYKPDQVYLYLSKEMLDRQRDDDRYRYCIQRLGEHLHHNFEVHCIEREELLNVQDFNYYFEDFRKIVTEIQSTMEKDDRLLVNIASGTPAMKSGLLFLATISDYRFQPIQVRTPARSMNFHPGKNEEYDPEYYWEINQDNVDDYENRCEAVQCPNLVALLKKNIIKKHILAYDYPAALSLVDEIDDDIPMGGYQLLQAAMSRVQLDLPAVSAVCNKQNIDFLPIKDSNKAIIFEYALGMKVKIEHKEYADFIRSISPLLADLFEMILAEQCGFDIKKYCTRSPKNVLQWDLDKLSSDLKGKQALEILNEEYSWQGGFRDKSPVAASNMRPLLEAMLTDEHVKSAVVKMRQVEADVRNLAAHEIVAVTDDKIKKVLGNDMSVEHIYSLIKTLVIGAKIKVKKEDWNSYDYMNKILIEKLDLE